MALVLSEPITDMSGNTYPASYWRPDASRLDRVNGEANIAVNGYASAEAAAARKRPVPGLMRFYRLTGEQFEAYRKAADRDAFAYSYVKANDAFFAGAKDA